MSATLNSPSFLDSFNPHSHAHAHAGVNQGRGGGSPAFGGVSGVSALSATMSPFGSQTSTQVAANQVQRFTYWNYVGIRLICDRASEPFPTLSYVNRAPVETGKSDPQQRGGRAGQSHQPQSSRSGISLQDRQWVRQHYGWLQSAEEDFQPLPDNHALFELLNNPNPDDTWNEFAYEHFLFLNLTGKVYWWVIPNGVGLPCQMAVIPTQWVRADYGRDGLLSKYIIMPDGSAQHTLDLPPEQVIESKLKSPRNKRDGWSPISAAPLWTANVESIEASRSHSYRNGANPDLLIMLGDEYADPSDAVIERVKEKFMRRASGLARSGEPQVVPPKVKIEKWSNVPKDMDYLNSADQARDANLAIHNAPKVLAGITTDVNRATVEAAEVVFCSSKINPQLRHFAGTLTWLARRFDPRIRVWYPDVTPKNAQQELLEDQADFQMGAMTPDERRQKRGRKPMGEPSYESGYLPAALSPLADELHQQALDEQAAANEAANEAAAALMAAKGDAGDGEETEEDEGKPGKPTPKAGTSAKGKESAAKPAPKKQSASDFSQYDAIP